MYAKKAVWLIDTGVKAAPGKALKILIGLEKNFLREGG